MNKKLYFLILCVVGTFSACATTTVQLPSNASLISGAFNASYIDKIDFSYEAQKSIEFSKLKLCIAENISNDDVTLTDSAGSFVGSYTGKYYRMENNKTVSGKDIFKYIDDGSSTVLVNGRTIANGEKLLTATDIVKFELKSMLSGNKVTLLFSKITRAQQDTGSLQNNGFSPVGVWVGSRAQGTYDALDQVSKKIKTCLM